VNDTKKALNLFKGSWILVSLIPFMPSFLLENTLQSMQGWRVSEKRLHQQTDDDDVFEVKMCICSFTC
jgi:hypothetical protein